MGASLSVEEGSMEAGNDGKAASGAAHGTPPRIGSRCSAAGSGKAPLKGDALANEVSRQGTDSGADSGRSSFTSVAPQLSPCAFGSFHATLKGEDGLRAERMTIGGETIFCEAAAASPAERTAGRPRGRSSSGRISVDARLPGAERSG